VLTTPTTSPDTVYANSGTLGRAARLGLSQKRWPADPLLALDEVQGHRRAL